MSVSVSASPWFFVIVGVIAAFAVFMITAFTGLGDYDRNGRVRMPGKRVLTLDEGKYGVYYEERQGTNSNETFEPPKGIRLRVRALDDTRDPKLDLGGLGSQVGTDNFTAETIGSLEVSGRGRYRVVVGRPPEPGFKPAITLGPPGGESFVKGGKRAGIILGVSALLAGAFALFRRTRPAPGEVWG